jgi:hypothetical protein
VVQRCLYVVVPRGRVHVAADGVVLQAGAFTSPPVLVGTLVLLLAILLVGRFLIGVAWKVVLVALAVVVVLWAIGALGSVLDVVG